MQEIYDRLNANIDARAAQALKELDAMYHKIKRDLKLN